MEFRYVRIQGRELSWVTKQPKGIFGMCWRMVMDGEMTEEDAEVFRAVDAWFVANLPEPPMCKTGDQQVITYFRTETAGEMLPRLEPAIALLEKYHHPYDVVYTNFVGEIVYEDRWQVAVRCGEQAAE